MRRTTPIDLYALGPADRQRQKLTEPMIHLDGEDSLSVPLRDGLTEHPRSRTRLQHLLSWLNVGRLNRASGKRLPG